VLGLLGPNGAGKTTTMRMLMGLILPSEGRIRIFGHEVRPGAPVLSRLGSFIEGPGFLPHLSGHENLTLYWRSTGRTAPAHLDVALEIAGLGQDVDRKVRTYSQGMRQRLAIAQAMLGLPDLLVLDEPTNGLDPPQIREMREVLARYAATGRTVVVSSHLLAEVEQSCSHVVVMAAGRLVAQGPVDELVGNGASVVVEVDDAQRAAEVAQEVEGVREVRVEAGALIVHASPEARAELVRRLVLADLRVSRIAPQRGLEETFLALVGEAG
jgi:ABC-2 type transport system ATP-binding protein